jgi:CubicO group peptidase (beta-lactamase class C family)
MSGLSYSDYMRKAVWQPLGMLSVRLDDPLDLIPNRVRGCQLLNGEIKNSEFMNVSSRFAAGGTRGTVPDLISFIRGIQEGRLLSEKSLSLIYAPMATRNGEAIPYSTGWQVPPSY